MFHHMQSLESTITDLYNNGKMECCSVDKTTHRYKIEFLEGTVYFDSIRALDVIKHGKSWNIQNPKLMCWNGHWISQTTLSLEDLRLTALYWIVRSI